MLCYADGIHINGNTDKVFLRNVEGKVGDDIIALNMFDWKDSSINFGPIDTVWCENIKLHRDSPLFSHSAGHGTFEKVVFIA